MPATTNGARRWALALMGCALWGIGAARADEPPDLDALRQEVRQRQQEIDRRTRLIEDLQKRVGQLQGGAAAPAAPGDLPPPPPSDRGTVEKMVGEYLQRREAERAAQEEAAKARADEEGHKVGTDLGMRVRWNTLDGVTFETPNKDFTSHLGLYFQYDSVWFTQSAALKSPTQVGDLQDGSFFRRIRPEWDGTAWEVFEWRALLALEQVNNDVVNISELYAGLMQIPVIGSVRVGKVRIPQGLESGTYSGNASWTFMEVSPSGTAFYEQTGPGVWTSNSVLDQRVTWAGMFYRQDNVPGGSDSGQNGVSFGDGKYAWAARLTALPLYENDGRQLLHLGASLGWRKAEDVPAAAGTEGGITGPTFIDFRTRSQPRDSIGDYGGTNRNNATPVGLPGNSKQIIDTGLLTASSSWQVGTEFLYILGPFSLQGEWTWASANDTVVPNPSPGRTGPTTLRLGDVWFDGGYVQLSYFLTGENRLYDRRQGRIARNPIGSPYTPFWLTRGEDGNYLFGRGAWEIAARYSHLDLNNGRFIQAGQTDVYEVGLTWYLNANLRIMCEYAHQLRYRKSTGPNGTLPGDIDGLGIRTQFMF